MIVDTSFVLPDVLWTARNSKQSTFLDFIDLGLIRAFAAHHVWAEVPRKISEVSAAEGVRSGADEAIWWGECAQRIRFVDVAGLDFPRGSQIFARVMSSRSLRVVQWPESSVPICSAMR